MSTIEFADGKPLTEDEVHQAAANELKESARYMSDELAEEWRLAYGYLKGDRPPPNAATSSTVVSQDVADAIEWVLPAVLKPLIESPDVIRFDPVTPEDEEQAVTESDYCHHVLMKQCNGFLKLYEHIKDALLLRVGVFATYWDDEVENRKEEYEALTELELADLMYPSDGSEVRETSRTATEVPLIDPMTGGPLQVPPGMPQPTETRYDVAIRRFTPRGKPVVEVCTPESFRVRMTHNSIDLDDARYCAYTIIKSRAEVYAMGYDAAKVRDIPAAKWEVYEDEIRIAREDVEESSTSAGEDNETGDPSQDMIELHRVYMMLDVDGDGHEERYLILLGGGDGQVLLDWHEVPENPFSASTPFIAAHKFYGYSLFNKLKQLADHKTKVLRMLEDNLDLVNNPRKNVVRGQVTLTDVLLDAPGCIRRVDAPGMIEDVPTLPMATQAFQTLDYYDKMRAERTGVDPNAQSASAMMPDESMNSAMERVISMREEVIGLMIRVFAETGVKSMLMKIRGLMARHATQEQLVKLRNKWVTLNPGNWQERSNTTTVVGLGTGDRIRKTQGLLQTFEMQKQAREQGFLGLLVSSERMQHTASELIRVQGLGDPDDFWLDPAFLADPRNQQTPRGQEVTRAMQQAQAEQQQAQQAQQAQQQAQAEQQQALLGLQREIAQMQNQAKLAVAQTQAQTADKDRAVEMQQFLQEMRKSWAELAADIQTERAKQAATVGTALIQQGGQLEQAALTAEGKSDEGDIE